MGSVVLMIAIRAVIGLGPDSPAASGRGAGERSMPEFLRAIPLEDVRGAADKSVIPGRIDHMRYDPGTRRLFIACVANGSLEVIDCEEGRRAGTISGLAGPQGVAVAGGWVYVATGDDGRLRRFNTRTLAAEKSVAVGDDADNVRVAGDGKVWVSFGGTGPGGLSCFAAESLALEKSFPLPRMPEGFQLHASGKAIFANMPAGKRSKEDGTVVGLKVPGGNPLWERKLVGHAGNFPMALDSVSERLFVVSRGPARLICLSTRDGSILGECDCPAESDDLFFDAESGLVAVIGGGSRPAEGDSGGVGASLDLFSIDGSGRPSRLGGAPLPPHSRTGTLAANRRAIYVGVPMANDRPAEVREYRLPEETMK